MKAKKLLTLAAVAVLSLGLVACGLGVAPTTIVLSPDDD